MPGDALAHLPGQIEAGEVGTLSFQEIHDTQRLRIMLEPAVLSHIAAQRGLTGMPEWRMTQVMHPADRLRESGSAPGYVPR